MNIEQASKIGCRLHRQTPAAPSIGVDPPEWTRDALCLQFDPEMWFPGKTDWTLGRKAKQVCAACPVTTECLIYGMHDPHGIYGGLTAMQRRRLRNPRGTVA